MNSPDSLICPAYIMQHIYEMLNKICLSLYYIFFYLYPIIVRYINYQILIGMKYEP